MSAFATVLSVNMDWASCRNTIKLIWILKITMSRITCTFEHHEVEEVFQESSGCAISKMAQKRSPVETKSISCVAYRLVLRSIILLCIRFVWKVEWKTCLLASSLRRTIKWKLFNSFSLRPNTGRIKGLETHPVFNSA